MKKKLHIISFDIPYPPNYGGVIDVYFKIKELAQLGIAIYLHCYYENNENKQSELENICEKVFYYPRNNFIFSAFSTLPFRVKSRSSNLLINNLKAIKAPILMEGLQSAYLLSKEIFSQTFVRAHNIEHTYLFGLAKSEKNIFKKIFFYIEGCKLKKFEKTLEKATGIFSISPFEQHYFFKKYGEKSTYIPVFFESTKNNFLDANCPKFILYHGDLRVSDNVKAALFLIEIYKNSEYQLVIASSCEHQKVVAKIKKHSNISFKNIPNQNDLEILLSKAHINTLVTFQKTGIKLKLLNTLFKGKFIIANLKMVEETGLEDLCEIADTKEEILSKTAFLFRKEVSTLDFENRFEKLATFNPTESAKKMIEVIFKQ
ncbi:MAG: hypothetical protein NWS05_05665 [Polaribacter sp.]|jgi:hypothetical protein|nr:hypothetical protein [Polaribacter sp.]